MYESKGCITHRGDTINSGHFIFLSNSNDKIKVFDDTEVTLLENLWKQDIDQIISDPNE